MKITFVLPFAGLAGGIRVAAIYAKYLQDKGHDVTVVSTPKPGPGTVKERLKKLLTEGLPKKAGHEPGHFDHLNVRHKVIDRWRPVVASDVPDADVIIATWWETAEWVVRLPPEKGTKVYFIQHDERFQYMPAARVEKTWQMPFYRITIAEWLVDLGRHHYHVDQVALVPNGVDTDQFTAPPREKNVTPTIGLMYAPTPFKGVDISLKAFDMAARNVAGLEMVAFGQHLPTESLPLPRGARFTHRPAQDRIKDIYAACDAWLFGSRSEGFGLPILEAFACRTPVIGTPTGAAPELCKTGGVLVKPQDPLDMARAIERVCRLSKPEWRALSDAAYDTAQRNTWGRCGEMFEAALLDARARDGTRAGSSPTGG
ncbi:MAG TPA: glycosyltransferase family 4 protein [Tepidisphaeraceae bacterium]|jgi:glycosyltransferase involved in cell wall biosynthesis